MISPQTVNILNTIVEIVIALEVIALIVAVPVSIVLFIRAFSREDHAKKMRSFIWSAVSILAPIVLLFITLSVWGLVNILNETAK